MKCHVAKCRGATKVISSRIMSGGKFERDIPRKLQSNDENTVVRKRGCNKCGVYFFTKEFSTLTKW